MGFIITARLFALVIIAFVSLIEMVRGGAAKPAAMFVFGDSYVDTGNHNKANLSWKVPYGHTWPGRPAGRYSDGYVLTDMIAQAMGCSSPVPYGTMMKYSYHHALIKHGVNFAVGGSGLFEAYDPRNFSLQVDQLNMTLQTHPLHQLCAPLAEIPTIVNLGGNDYSHYIANNGSIGEIPQFIQSVVNEITRNLVRLYELGLRRFAVSNLGQLGCVPYQTSSNGYRHCNDEVEPLVKFHNALLATSINSTLANLDDIDFIVVDQYQAFSYVLENPYLFGIKHKLKPCCAPKQGIDNAGCGLEDENGQPLYNLCSNPKRHLFWDGVHPTQAGWAALSSVLFKDQNSTQSYSGRDLEGWLIAN